MIKNINANNLAAFYQASREEDDTTDLFGEVVFPARKKIGLDLAWIKGAKATPITLKPSEFDVKATLRDRIGLEISETKMPFFKEKMKVKETERQELLRYYEHPNKTLYNTVIQHIFDDKAHLVESAAVAAERMRMQLITQGRIEINDNRVHKTYDYGFDYDNNLIEFVGDEAWDQEGGDPIRDIGEVLENGVGGLKYIIMNSKTLGVIKRHPKVIELIHGDANSGKLVRTLEIEEILNEEYGLELVIYDKQFAETQGGEVKKFVPDGVISIIPEEVGNTWYGTTPEEADLMAGMKTDAEVAVVDTGVAITTTVQTDPVNVETKVSQITLPSGENIDSVYILNVF